MTATQTATSTRLTGHDAIEHADAHGLDLSKHADPVEGAREGLTVSEARAVASEDPGLIYLDIATNSAYMPGTKVRRCSDQYWSGTETGEIVESDDKRVRIKWAFRRTWQAKSAEGVRWVRVLDEHASRSSQGKTTETLTPTMIADLRREAADAGDRDLVKACDDANHYHSGRRAQARHDCAEAITAARAMDDETAFVA